MNFSSLSEAASLFDVQFKLIAKAEELTKTIINDKKAFLIKPPDKSSPLVAF